MKRIIQGFTLVLFASLITSFIAYRTGHLNLNSHKETSNTLDSIPKEIKPIHYISTSKSIVAPIPITSSKADSITRDSSFKDSLEQKLQILIPSSKSIVIPKQ